MIQESQPPVVRSYLSELDKALIEVPREVAKEIAEGVAEELAGLDAVAAATRIEELGDPAFIAAEARTASESVPPEATPAAPTSPAPPATVTPRTEERWFVVLASLLVATGGVVIPVLGWIAGIVMVWMSKSWRTWEKWVGTLTPVAIAVLLIGASFLARSLSPDGLTGWLLAVLSVFFSPFLAGMWLLWRGLRRPASPERRVKLDAPGSQVDSGADARWYVVVASLLVAVGGVVIPALGWIVGIAMVWISTSWHRWEKWVATLAAPLITGLVVLITWRLFAGTAVISTVGSEVSNPLVPALFDGVWSGVILFMAVNLVVGLWLLARAMRRGERFRRGDRAAAARLELRG